MPRSPRAIITQSLTRRISSALLDRLGLLDLRDQRDARVLAHERHVLRRGARSSARPGRRRSRCRPAGAPGPPRGRRAAVDARAGDVQALPRRDRAADLDLGVDLAVARRARRPRAGARRRRRGRAPRRARPRRRRPGPRDRACRARSPSAPLSWPQWNVTRSPALELDDVVRRARRCAASGPGRSCRIATGRPARPAASRTQLAPSRRAARAMPWLKFSRATSIPASTIRTSVSGSREAGPIVATIFVLRSTSWSVWSAPPASRAPAVDAVSDGPARASGSRRG